MKIFKISAGFCSNHSCEANIFIRLLVKEPVKISGEGIEVVRGGYRKEFSGRIRSKLKSGEYSIVNIHAFVSDTEIIDYLPETPLLPFARIQAYAIMQDFSNFEILHYEEESDSYEDSIIKFSGGEFYESVIHAAKADKFYLKWLNSPKKMSKRKPMETEILNESEKNALEVLQNKYKLENEEFYIINGHVTYLDLSNRGLTQIEGLEQFSELEKLKIGENNISKIEGLEKLSQLKILYIVKNKIKKIEGLENLSQLEELYLSDNQIEKIEGLENLSQLKILNLKINKIEKIEGIENLSQLEDLYLSYNQIKKIEGLGNLSKLGELDLKSNQINKIKGLKELSNLHTLDLSNNQITNVEELGYLNKLEQLYPNDIIQTEQCRNIATQKILQLIKEDEQGDIYDLLKYLLLNFPNINLWLNELKDKMDLWYYISGLIDGLVIDYGEEEYENIDKYMDYNFIPVFELMLKELVEKKDVEKLIDISNDCYDDYFPKVYFFSETVNKIKNDSVYGPKLSVLKCPSCQVPLVTGPPPGYCEYCGSMIELMRKQVG